MLGLLGLFGLIFAGYIAEGFMPREGSEPDHGADGDGAGGDDSASDDVANGQSLLDWAADAPPVQSIPSAPVQTGVELDASDPASSANSSDDPAPPDAPLRLNAGSGGEVLRGKAAADMLRGGAGGDALDGGDGDDWLLGGAGDDQAHGGRGADLVEGGTGDDSLHGEDGNDTLRGGAGDDLLAGHDGMDLALGGPGHDTLLGGGGNDILAGGPGADWLAGGAGDDVLVAGPGADTLDGGTGDDTLIGGFGWELDARTSYLNGGPGDDVLVSGAHVVATGGPGADRFVLIPESATPPDAAGRITDFDPGEDELLVIYDAAAHPSPALVLRPGPAGDVAVLLDGLLLAQVTLVPGATLQPGQVRLVAEAAVSVLDALVMALGE